MDSATEDRIVRLRKELSRKGFDAGAETIRVHLQRDPACARVPAVSTIWRILVRRGFVSRQPAKRPRSGPGDLVAKLPGTKRAISADGVQSR